MNHLTAYVRTNMIEEVIHALQKAGAPGITIVCGVHAVGYGYLPNEFTWRSGEMGTAPEALKVEVVCREEDCDRLLETLVDAAHTELKGDGLVFVSNVKRAVRIRTREEGPEALRG